MHAFPASLVADDLLHLRFFHIDVFYPDCAKIHFRMEAGLGKRLGQIQVFTPVLLLLLSYLPSKMLKRLVFAIARYVGSILLVSGAETSSGIRASSMLGPPRRQVPILPGSDLLLSYSSRRIDAR